ncbi:MAG: hypothetical protein QOJ42_4854 [Acidobacteriaceae bacterium]|nr:hypothetical protein [Acidobacteriaceae bacterium]
MAELADAADSKSADRKVVGVRPPLPAPTKQRVYTESAAQNERLIFVWWLFWWLLLIALPTLERCLAAWKRWKSTTSAIFTSSKTQQRNRCENSAEPLAHGIHSALPLLWTSHDSFAVEPADWVPQWPTVWEISASRAQIVPDHSHVQRPVHRCRNVLVLLFSLG